MNNNIKNHQAMNRTINIFSTSRTALILLLATHLLV